MQDDSADTDRIEQLTDRIDRLENVAAAQQETIKELHEQSTLGKWGRRSVLGSIAAALGLSAASGSAAAGVGDVGTASSRVDVFGDVVDTNTLEADSAIINETTAQATLKNSNQTVSSASRTKVQFDTSDIDDSELYDIDLQNNEIVVLKDGTYRISGSIRWITDGWTSQQQLAANIRINGTLDERGNGRYATLGDGQRQTINTPVFEAELSANDIVTMRAFQTTGSSKDIGPRTTALKVSRSG